MSANLYLNNKVRDLNGFKSQPYPDNSGDKMTLNGMHVFHEKGRLYLMWGEDAVIPEELKDLVEDISCYETIPRMGHRESGVYRLESAECELTPVDYGNAKREKPMYMLKVTAKSLEDIKAILHLVKTGAIRPDESYEEPQGGKTRRQLEDELALTQRKLGEAVATAIVRQLEAGMEEESRADLVEQFEELREKNARLRRSLALHVEKGVLPFLFLRSRVVRRVGEILNNTE